MFFAEAEELVVSVFAGAVIEIIVAISATGAVGLVRADKVVVTPVVDTVAAAIEFLSIRAHGNTHSVVEDGSSLARFAMAVADQDLLGGAGTFVLASRAGLGWDQLTRAPKAAGGFAGDGQLRASIQAQIGYTRSRGTGGLNINVQVRTRSSQLGAASSRSST